MKIPSPQRGEGVGRWQNYFQIVMKELPPADG